ncbi:MAG TPA: hypothetical protein VK993_08715 [Chthoniobacterales bacterium]|nr:hypothetical protein [Chthoniobacterales bacterium]
MFPLYSKKFPENAVDLAVLLNDSVKRVFANAANPVVIRDKAYPALSEIRITLNGAELRSNPPPPPKVRGNSLDGLRVDDLHIDAAGLLLGPATADLRLGARDVRLNQAKDANGEAMLMLQGAADGVVEITAAAKDIEAAIAALAKSEAGKHGVQIDQVRLTVKPRGERSVDGQVQLRAKKLFFSTVITISAKLDLDHELNASVSGLKCHGEGAIGALGCGFLEPHLNALNGRTFPLMALPLGEVRLRDVRIAATDRITVSAEFGA